MKKAILTLLGLCVAAYALYLALPGTRGSWHQRLTVTVDTPRGEVSGSAVSEIRYTFYANPSKMTGREVDYGLTGEATVVEVTPGRYLFALIVGSEERFAMAAMDRFKGMTRGEWLRELPGQTEPVILTGDAIPMLVTFDDISRPETVRLVDPDDLDATFGCDRENQSRRFPWRDAGLIYQDWVKKEVERLSRDMAADKAGIVGPAGDAVAELYGITDDMNISAAEEVRAKELHSIFTEEQRQRWANARQALITELPSTLATPQAVSAETGGPCYRLKPVTLEISDEGVTKGTIAEFAFWEELKDQVTFSGLDRYDNANPEPLNYLTYQR